MIIKAKYKASDVAARLGLKIRLYCSQQTSSLFQAGLHNEENALINFEEKQL